MPRIDDLIDGSLLKFGSRRREGSVGVSGRPTDFCNWKIIGRLNQNGEARRTGTIQPYPDNFHGAVDV